MNISFFPSRLCFLLLLAGMIPLLGMSQSLNANFHALQNSEFRAEKQDSLRGTAAQLYHCQVKFGIPDYAATKTVHIQIVKNGTGAVIKQISMPIRCDNGTYEGITYFRKGKDLMFDFGDLHGNPSYKAIIELEDRKGRRSAPVDLLVSP